MNIKYYNDALYFVERTTDDDYCLYRTSRSFNDMEKLSTLASISQDMSIVSTTRAAMIFKGYLYYITSTYDPQYAQKDYMAIFQCRRVKLEKGAIPEVLGEFEYPGDYGMAAGDSNGFSIFVCEDTVYYIASGTARWYTTNHSVQYRVIRYDTIS